MFLIIILFVYFIQFFFTCNKKFHNSLNYIIHLFILQSFISVNFSIIKLKSYNNFASISNKIVKYIVLSYYKKLYFIFKLNYKVFSFFIL